MRNHALKRIFAMLLVVAMVLATLPAISLGASAASFEATASSEIPLGTKCVIYNANGSAIFGYDITDGNAAGKYSVASEEGTLKVPNGSAAVIIAKNSDSSYSLTIGGKYLAINSAEALSLSDTVSATSSLSTRWDIAYDATNGGYTIASKDVKYNSKAVYLEYYSSKGFCGYSYKSDSPALFMFNFFTLNSDADPDGDGYIGTRPVAGGLPADGDTVVLYNAYGEGVIGPMNAETGSSMDCVAATVKDGVIDVEDGGLIFTVHIDPDGYYTFENGGKYLANPENYVDENGKTNNEETLFLQDTESEYTKWTLTATTGGYIIYNKTAKYGSSSVCIEYFTGAFSGWSYYASQADYYIFNFYHVDDTADHMTSKPGVTIGEMKPSIGKDCVVTITVNDHKDISAVSATYSLDGAAGKTVTPTETATAKVYSFTIPTAELEGHKTLSVTVETTNTDGGKATATAKENITDEPVILSYSPESATGTGSDKKPTITVNFANAGEGATYAMTVNGTAVTPTIGDGVATYTFPTAQADGKVIVSFTITRKDGKSATREWSFYIGEAGLGLYFGQFHSHTSEYSDGAGTLEQAYEHARNAKDVDFLIVTDHSNYFDTTTTATKDSIYDAAADSLTKSTTTDENGVLLNKWQEAKATAAQYTDDNFVAAYGYEMTWSGGPGHVNSFNTLGIVSRNNAELNNKTNYSGMLAYYDLTVDANAKNATWTGEGQISSMFNHPGTTFGTFGDFTGYTPTRDSVMNLIEVGNGEGAVGGSSYWPSYNHYDNALAMGWHIAPANNQDNHKGNWGDSNTCRDVVITDNFTEQGIYDAMAARHIYATEDQNLNILYYLKADANGDGTISEDEAYLQGDIINLDTTSPLEKVTFSVSFRDPDGEALGKIEVIGEGGSTLWSKEVTSSSYEMNVTLDNTDAYYYIKVTEADGDIAVTAPVWVGQSLAILFTGINSSAALSVTGEEETITTTFSNSSDYDFNVTKLTYTVDGKAYFTDTKAAGTTVKANTAATEYTMKYVPKTAGKHVIKVTMEGTVPDLDNKKVTVSTELTVKSYDASSLISVGVDKGHTNYYVSGDYSDTANNFISFCADNGARCNYIEAGEFTYENLSQYKLVVLTVPYRRNSGAATMYTADEIAALAKYTENGGNVIICSKSDRDNKYDNCANNSNALLEAIGAHSRIVNGIIVDNELKANEAYRLYLSSIENFNTEHRFTKGAYTSSNAFETVPDPDNETGFQLYNGGPVEIMEGYEDKVEVLVKGYDSTWGSNYDGYFTGSSFVPEYDETTCSVKMGDVNVMTYEDLPGGGWVITSGVTFFSDYDIKDDVNYTNKYILRNILNDLTGANDETITSISKVKTTPESESGKEFTIEGYVTANASGYDKNTAFFDCIYVQDAKGNGINVFPVSGSYAVGMNVRVHGAVTYYCGEIELNTSDMYDGYVTIISDEINKLAPTAVSCKDAMADKNIGLLMSVTGTIKEVHKTAGIVDKIYVDDGSGKEACVFINGYILNSADDYSADFVDADGNKVEPAPGMKITAVGIGSRDVDETSATAAIFARLRVRDRAEIKVSGDADYAFQFDDVKTGSWYYSAVQFVAEHGLMDGVTTRTFEPKTKLNRAMAVTILYRLDGKPSVSGVANPFSDVPAGKYYTDAVLWGVSNNIVKGMSDTKFDPKAYTTREQMVTFLYRYANYKGYDTTARGDLSKFPDASSVSKFATDSVQWAVAEGIINGDKGTDGVVRINPKGNATRAEFAAIMMRFVNRYAPEFACTEHDFVETEHVDATCTEDGHITMTCSICGTVTNEVLPALGHDYASETTKEATCTETGLITHTCSRCGDTYTETIPMLAHDYVDGVCSVCGAEDPYYVKPEIYTLADGIEDGDKVIIYNPGHGKAIKNETDNNWYLIAQEVAPVDGKIENSDATIVWDVKKNDDGTYSFTNGDNAITAWLNGTYVELTNNASYDGGDTKWNVTECNAATKTFFIGSSSISTSYGTGYVECFLKNGVDKIAGYAKSTPTEADFGFQFYALEESEDDDPTDPPESTDPSESTDPTDPVTPTDPAGYTQITDPADLKAGGKYIITASNEGINYYMSEDNTTKTGALMAVAYTDLKDATVWTLSASDSAEGCYTLSTENGGITYGSSGTNVKLSSTPSALQFTYDAANGGMKVAFVELTTARCLAFRLYNGEPLFKAYAESNFSQTGYDGYLTIYQVG